MNKVKGLRCILLVDDDEPTNFLNKIVIQKSGIKAHVQIAENGREALDYLSCKGTFSHEKEYPQPGIIFLDINMPGMNGWEFLEEYHKLPDNQKASVVIAMLTTSMNPDDELRGKQNVDVKDFRSKPLTEKMILDIINEYFELDA